MGSPRAAILGGPRQGGLESDAASPRWRELLAQVEVLLATLREQVVALESSEAAERRPRRTVTRERLLSDIDAARAAVKHARRRMAGLRSPATTSRPVAGDG